MTKKMIIKIKPLRDLFKFFITSKIEEKNLSANKITKTKIQPQISVEVIHLFNILIVLLFFPPRLLTLTFSSVKI